MIEEWVRQKAIVRTPDGSTLSMSCAVVAVTNALAQVSESCQKKTSVIFGEERSIIENKALGEEPPCAWKVESNLGMCF